MKRTLTVAALCLCGMLAFRVSGFAQTAAGKIVGTVTDSAGAVLPNSSIIAVNTATGIRTETKSDESGFYQILNLPIGKYRVEADHDGFRKLLTDEQPLEINQSLRLNLVMQVGARNETVQVEANTAGVETVNSTVGLTITGAAITNAPLNGRNVLDLALLQPGVTETNPGNGGAGTFQIGGGKSDSVTFLLDGGLNNNLLSNGVVFNPNPDAVAEFKLLENNYSAEYGRNAGGIVSVVTKSGSNNWHGSAYDYARNDAFNANRYFNKRNGAPRDILKRHQFGGTLGGPVTIPKVVSGKDKLFWFFSYQGQRQSALQTLSKVTTFTPAELQGNFSQSAAADKTNVINFLQKYPFFQPNPSLAAQGIIDPTRIDPVAQNYIKANLIPTSPTGSLLPRAAAKDNRDEGTIKIDYAATAADRFALTLGRSDRDNLNPFPGSSANVPGYPSLTTTKTRFANIGYARTFSPRVLNEFRFNVNRNDNNQAQRAIKLPNPNQLGINITPDELTGPTKLGFAKGLVIGFSHQGPTKLIDDTWNFADTVTWVKGQHTLKFGGQYIPYENNTVFDFFIDGEFFFDGSPAAGGIGSGNDFADFLFGLPDEFLEFPKAPSNIRTKAAYVFAQDEWHVRRNLVLSFGVRYERSTPKYDTQGRSFSLLNSSTAKSTRFVNAPTGLLFPGDPGAPKGANFQDNNDFAPRFGFAFDPFGDGKTSIRGGIGVFYDILKGEDNLQFNGQAPFFGFADLFPDPPATGNTKNFIVMTDPFKATGQPNTFPSKPPSKNIDFDASGFLPFGGGGVYNVDPHLRTPYTYQYNLSVQHEFAGGWLSEVGYLGSETHKQTGLIDANPFVLGTKHRVFNTLPGNTDGSITYFLEFKNVADANYNGLEASLSKRLNTGNAWLSGTGFTLGYTYGRSIDNDSGFRQRSSQVPSYNPHLFRAVSDYDLTHRLSASGVVRVPFDTLCSGCPKRLTQGWNLFPILSWHTGFPLDVFAGLSNSLTRVGPSGAGDPSVVHANLVGNGVTQFDPRAVSPFAGASATASYWFNPANFNRIGLSNTVVNPADPYGTLSRNFFRGPGRTNFDMSVSKNTPITERLNLKLSADFFNLPNHAQFSNPSTSITSGLFGQITATSDPRIIQLSGRIEF